MPPLPLTAPELMDDFARAWHRLDPWPDAVAGLTRLKQRYTISPLSNGTFALLNNMAKRAGVKLSLHKLRKGFGCRRCV